MHILMNIQAIWQHQELWCHDKTWCRVWLSLRIKIFHCVCLSEAICQTHACLLRHLAIGNRTGMAGPGPIFPLTCPTSHCLHLSSRLGSYPGHSPVPRLEARPLPQIVAVVQIKMQTLQCFCKITSNPTKMIDLCKMSQHRQIGARQTLFNYAITIVFITNKSVWFNHWIL